MRNTTRNKLFLLLKCYLFSTLAAFSVQACAEYDLVYSSPDKTNLCISCHKKPTKFKKYVSKKFSKHRSDHRYARRSSLYVSYPVVSTCPCNDSWNLNFCQCCPQPNRVRTQWGDYVVFSSRPADRRYGIHEEEENSYNPDMSTVDDSGADLEINE